MTHDAWLETEPEVDREEIRQRVEAHDNQPPFFFSSTLNFNRYGDMELRVYAPTRDQWEQVAEFDDDLDGFEQWMRDVDDASFEDAVVLVWGKNETIEGKKAA